MLPTRSKSSACRRGSSNRLDRERGHGHGRHVVRDRLLSAILNGEHKPGEQLRQQRLAEKWGVALSAVREALIELQASGFVRAIENRGMFVNDLSPRHVLEAMEVRERMEGLIAARCCQRITRAQVDELRDLARRIAAEGTAQNFQTAATIDNELHQRLLIVADNGMASRIAEQYHVVGKLLFLGDPRHAGERQKLVRSPEVVLAEHLSILQAIEAGDEIKAESLMRDHIRAARADVKRLIEAGHFSPNWLKTPSGT